MKDYINVGTQAEYEDQRLKSAIEQLEYRRQLSVDKFEIEKIRHEAEMATISFCLNVLNDRPMPREAL